jgi:hypothetical protein
MLSVRLRDDVGKADVREGKYPSSAGSQVAIAGL